MSDQSSDEKAITELKEELRRHRVLLEQFEAANKPSRLDPCKLSDWLKLLPYIVLGAIAIASLIMQQV